MPPLHEQSLLFSALHFGQQTTEPSPSSLDDLRHPDQIASRRDTRSTDSWPCPWAARPSSFLNPRVSGAASPDSPLFYEHRTRRPPRPFLRTLIPPRGGGRATLWAAGLRPRRPRVLLTRPRLGLSALLPSTATLAPPCLRRRVEQHEPGAWHLLGKIGGGEGAPLV